MSIITCPTCGTKLEIDDAQLGQQVQCGSCQQVFEAKSDVGEGRSRKSKFGREEDEEERPSKRRKSSRRDDDEEEDRPSRRRRYEEDDDEERPSRRRNKYRDDDDEDDYRPRRNQRPSQIQTVGVLLLIGGILAVLTSISFGIAGLGTFGICCLWPGTYYEMVFGILAIIRGSQTMGTNDPPDPPKGLCIMAIICIINGDILNLIFGIIGLTMLGAPEVIDYYSRRR